MAMLRAALPSSSGPLSKENLLGDINPEDLEVPPVDPKPNKEKKDATKKRIRKPEVDNKRRPGTGRAKDLTEDLTAMLTSFAMPLYMYGMVNEKLLYDAYIITQNAPQLAEQLNALAQRNPAVHRALFAMMNGTDSALLLMTVANMAIPIAANHGLIPKQPAMMLGAPDPENFDLEAAQNEQASS